MVRVRLLGALGALLLAGTLLGGGCRTESVQTLIVVEVRSDAAVDCIEVRVGPEGGTAQSTRVPVPTWIRDFRSQTARVAVYPGGELVGEVVAEASGLRGSTAECGGPVVAESAEPARATFREGERVTASLQLVLLDVDADSDGWEVTADCNDDDPDSFPGAPEVCGDELDQGCIGTPDLDCPCDPVGVSRSCYPLGLDHPTLLPSAACQVGAQVCEASGWGRCTGAVTPALERCDGIDTDCDGTADPASCPCRNGDTRTCYTAGPPELAGVGECVNGVATCNNERWGDCQGDVAPQLETCNGRDDDCDGRTDDPDEIAREPCELTLGVCGLAAKPCGAGAVQPCTATDFNAASGGLYEAEETACDEADNDCDGLIDEGCACDPGTTPTRPCYPFGLGPTDATVGVGPCVMGTQTCLPSGEWGACLDFVAPAAEVCDGGDENCDGIVDNVAWAGERCDAPGAVGLCAQGSLACDPSAGGDGRVCVPATPVEPDPACDGFDTDCDSTDTPANDDRDALCGVDELCCSRACVNIDNDPANCGDCEVRCDDDGLSCHDPACVSGQCTYTNWPDGTGCEADGLECTRDVCSSGVCSHPPVADGTPCTEGGGTICESGACEWKCFIDSTVYESGIPNPANECESCRPGADPDGWSPRGSLTPCTDDGNPCTADECSNRTCTHPVRADGTSCGSGQVCDGGTCLAGCWIGGTFRAPNEVRGSNPCQWCDPSRSTTAWSPRSATTSCNDGDYCTVNDLCDGSGSCRGGAARDCSSFTDGCNQGRCDETADACYADPRTIGTSCTTGGGDPGVCDGAGLCENSCYIGGSLRAAGSTQPGNVCRECDPARSRNSWSAVTDTGRTCDDEQVCTVADHCDGAGACTGGGAADCSSFDDACNVGTCTEPGGCAASPLAGGTGCGGGLICDGTGGCVSGCWIGGQLRTPGQSQGGNSCQVCDPASSTTSWTALPNFDACDDDGEECTDDYCIGGLCEHQPVTNGTSCGTNGRICTAGSCACPFGPGQEQDLPSESGNYVCGDGVDNDCDGDTDCADSGCDGRDCANGGKVCTAGTCE